MRSFLLFTHLDTQSVAQSSERKRTDNLPSQSKLHDNLEWVAVSPTNIWLASTGSGTKSDWCQRQLLFVAWSWNLYIGSQEYCCLCSKVQEDRSDRQSSIQDHFYSKESESWHLCGETPWVWLGRDHNYSDTDRWRSNKNPNTKGHDTWQRSDWCVPWIFRRD